MPVPLENRLRKRGWEEYEIQGAVNTLYSKDSQEKHKLYRQASSPILYWAGLLVLIIGNLFFAVVLVPVLIFLTSIQLYVVVGVMAVTFGLMFDFIIRDIEHVDEKHHIVAGVFIPAIALITIVVMVNLANGFATRLDVDVHQSVILVSAFYVLMFSLPYLIMKFREQLYVKKYSV